MLEWIQSTWVSTVLRESTWGYPIIGAIHVLGMAWFGATALPVRVRFPAYLEWAGLGVVFVSGVALFGLQPVRYYGNTALHVKLLLLVIIGVTRSRLSIVLWIGVVFASRAIAYF